MSFAEAGCPPPPQALNLWKLVSLGTEVDRLGRSQPEPGLPHVKKSINPACPSEVNHLKEFYHAKFNLPNVPEARIALWSQYLASEVDGKSPTTISLPPEFREEMVQSFARLTQAVAQVRSLEPKFARNNAERKQRAVALDKLMRDFLVVLDRRAKRIENGVMLSQIFAKKRPLLDRARYNYRLLLELGSDLVASEARAVAEGFGPSLDPTIGEVETLLALPLSAFDEAEATNRELKAAQLELREVQVLADSGLRRLGGYLRLGMRHLTPATSRAFLRTAGFVFRSSKGEVEPAKPATEASGQVPTTEAKGDKPTSETAVTGSAETRGLMANPVTKKQGQEGELTLKAS